MTKTPLVGLAEASEILGVKKQNVRSLAGLPRPQELSAGPVWSRLIIERFAEERRGRIGNGAGVQNVR